MILILKKILEWRTLTRSEPKYVGARVSSTSLMSTMPSLPLLPCPSNPDGTPKDFFKEMFVKLTRFSTTALLGSIKVQSLDLRSRKIERDFTVWGGNLFRRFCSMFSK